MMQFAEPKIERRYDFREPVGRVVEIHLIDCGCAACEPYVPSVPSRLTASDLVGLTVGGIGIASAVMFAFAGEAVSSAIAFGAIGAVAALRAAIGR